MWDTFYWINEAMKRHIQEFKAHPEMLAKMAGLKHGAIDLVARLEKLRNAAEQLRRDIRAAESGLGLAELESRPHGAHETDLTADELTSLRRMNERMNEVGQRTRDAARQIEAGMEKVLADPGSLLADYELDVSISFYLREDDIGASGDDNTVAQVDYLVGDLTDQYPDGYEGSMPHGRVFHDLHWYGGYDRGEVDYRDMLRIGTAWVDVIVRHQYLYDLTSGKWIVERSQS